jgi:S-DNA-T family DNA segregation ATPase FtsK/SpoIIIE
VSGWTIGGGGRLRELFPLSPWVILVGRLVRWFLVRPRLLAELALAACLLWRTGDWRSALAWWVALNLLVAIVLIAVVLRLSGASPSAIVTGVSRRARLLRRWEECAVAARLARTTRGEVRIPPLRRVRITATGLRVTALVGHVGRTVEHVTRERQTLAAVIGCREVYVRSGKNPGVVNLEFVWGDPLRRTIRLKDLPPPRDDSELTFGLSQDGDPVTVNRDTSLLVVGLTGSGKSGLIWALLASLVRSGVPYRLVVIDPKGGMELRALKPLAHRYAVMPDEVAQVLTDSVADMRARADALGDAGARRYTPTAAMPYTVLVVDEFLALTTFVPAKLRGRIERDLGLLITQGRAPGFVGWFCSQGSQLDALGRARTFIPQRACLATDDVETTVAALGNEARHSARCDQLSLKQPGVGYVHVDGYRGLRRFRAAFVTDAEAREVAAGRLPAGAFGGRLVTSSASGRGWGRGRGRGRGGRGERGGDGAGPERVALYRWVGADDDVLYVGISDDPDRRIGQHVQGKPWVEEAARVDIVEWHDSRAAALEAEERLIKLERPRYNVVHNRG